MLPVVHRDARLGRGAAGRRPRSPPAAPRPSRSYLTALVERYGPQARCGRSGPSCRGCPIRDWQIWNEPNLTRYWTAQPFAKRYVRCSARLGAALRAPIPGANDRARRAANESWIALREIYKAGGRGAFDAVALHPYTRTPANVLRLVRSRGARCAASTTARPVWLTELSWPAAQGKVRGPPGS